MKNDNEELELNVEPKDYHTNNIKTYPQRDYSRIKILKNFGQLSFSKNPPIFCLVDWNGYVRYDIRTWNEDMTIPKKGLSLTEQELIEFRNAYMNFNKNAISNTPISIYDSGSFRAEIFNNIIKFGTTTSDNITWSKEINIVNWGYGKKVDFRKWSTDYSKCGKGISISLDEADKLIEIIDAIF